MRLPRSLILIAAILIVIGVGCMLFQDIQVPERVLVDNGELPALESADHLQTSLRFHPENPLIASRLETEAGIDRGVWSFQVQQAMSGLSHAHGQVQIRFGTGDQGSAQESASPHRRPAAHRPGDLMVRGDYVYVTWIDNRFKRGFWTKRNFAKQFVTKSDDRGGSFGSPVSINPPRDNSENVGYSVTMPAADGGVLILWGTKWMGTGAKNQDLYYSWLQPDMQRLLVGKNMFPGDRLHETLVDNLLHHHRNLDAP